MKNISLDCLPLSLFVGYERENDARGVTFDYSAWAEQYGNGVLQLLVQRPGDADPYPVVLTAGENNTAVWLLSATDTAVKGQLEVQLIFTVGSVVAKTAVLPVLVGRSLAAGATPPDPYETWLETLTELAEQILHTTQPPEIRNGYWYIFDPDTGEYVNSGVKAEGEDGVGITGAQLNADYTLTLSFSDGTSYTTPSIRGAQGEPGPTPQLSIGAVTTGAAGSSAAVEITGTPEAPVLNFTIPRGDTGEVSEAELQAALLDKADIITDTASGAIASFSDGAAAPVKALTVAVEPVQDLHGYDAPWPAGGGKNKFPITLTTQTKNGTTFTVADDGTVTISGTPTAQTRVLLNGLVITPDAEMAFSVTGTATGVRVFVRANNSGTVTYPTISPSGPLHAGVTYDQFYFEVNTTFAGTASSFKFQLEVGSTATSYAPYSNLCPITGWQSVEVWRTGVNVWDEEWEPGIYSSLDGSPIVNNNRIRSKNPIPVKPNTSYYFYCGNSDIGIIVHYFNASGEQIQTATPKNSVFTTPSNTAYIKFNTSTADLTTYNHDISINYPSTDHDYHAYSGTTDPIPFNTTVYGCTLEVLTGVLTVDMVAYVFDGTLTGAMSTSPAYPHLYTVGLLPYTGVQMPFNQNYCSHYKPLAGNFNESCFYLQTPIGNRRVSFNDIRFTTAAEFRNYFAEQYAAGTPVTVCYKLATPFEISLTPEEIETLKGTNNFWSDAGDVSVEYRADTKLYIEKKITAAIAAALNS